MKNSILTRLIVLVSLVTFISLTVISFANYQMTYLKVKESAGIELYGCANITTGLLTPDEISKLQSLSSSEAAELGDKLSWTVDHKPIFDNQYLISPDGKVLVADENTRAQGINVGDSTPIDQDVLDTILETRAATYSDVYEFSGMKRLSGYAPIFENHDPQGEIVGLSVIDFNASILTERTWSMVSATIIVGIISLLIAGIIIILFVRKTILPLRHLTDYTRQIAQGDLSSDAQTLKASGEIKVLNENFNVMVENLKNALDQTAATSRDLSSSSEELSVSTAEIADIVEEVSATFQTVAESANRQASESEHIQTVFQKIANRTNEISERVQMTAKNSVEASSFANKGNEIIVESMEQMSLIQLSAANVADTMKELKEKSNKIHEILNIIMNISKQTNLLALNASIESARAGEYGRGFAVVADEIRSLSEETSKSIESISTIIFEIGKTMEEAANLTEQGNRTVEIGMEKVKNAGDSFNDIKQSTQMLSDDIAQVLQETVNIQNEVGIANTEVGTITAISREISGQMQTVAASSEQQTASIEEVSSAIQMLAHMASEMEKLTNQFKLSK